MCSLSIISVLALKPRLMPVAAGDLNHFVLERYQEQEPVSSNDSLFLCQMDSLISHQHLHWLYERLSHSSWLSNNVFTHVSRLSIVHEEEEFEGSRSTISIRSTINTNLLRIRSSFAHTFLTKSFLLQPFLRNYLDQRFWCTFFIPKFKIFLS